MRRFTTFLVLVASLVLVAAPAGADSHFTARLTGNQVTPWPGVATAATGTASFALTSGGLRFYVTVEGLSGAITGATINRSPAGVVGPTVRDILLEFGGRHTAGGIWTTTDATPLTSALITDLMNGNLSVNIFTAANPGGEIRGQIQLSAGVHFTANLQGVQENPGTGVAGTGTGSFTLTGDGLHYTITANNLTGAITDAHIHTGAIGVNGGVTFPIFASFSGTSAQGFIGGLTLAQRKDLITGNMYVNIHTGAFPGGEIRGQIHLAGGYGFSIRADGGQETPPNAAPGLGTGSATLTSEGLLLDFTASGLTGAIIGAHLHNAAAGVPGGVVRTFGPADMAGPTTVHLLWRSDDAEPLTPKLIAELLNERIYVNIHTAAFGGGEIRGQLVLGNPSPITAGSYTANLTYQQEEPPIAAPPGPPLGTASFQLGPGGLGFRITAHGLTGAMIGAHFHLGGIGVGGGIVRGILAGEQISPNTIAGTWTPADAMPFTAAMMTELIRGNLYFNIHTAANGGGEIRGQILPASGAEFAARLDALQETPPNATGGLGAGSFTLTPWGLGFHITFNGLTGALTGSHIHLGGRGVAGGVVRGFLAGEFVTPNTLSGVWKPTDGAPLTPTLVSELMKGNLYVNLHTAAFGGGEIRGQITLSGGIPFGAQLRGPNEVPPNASPGKGTAAMTLTDEGHVFRLSNNDMMALPTSAEFGNAPAGMAGPTVRPFYAPELLGSQSADGVWKMTDVDPLTPFLIGEMFMDNVFVDVNTGAFPPGEIRGQLGTPLPTVGVPPGIASTSLELSGAPNPAHDAATFSFHLPRRMDVRLAVYDLAGAEVARLAWGSKEGGWHRVPFSTARLSSGVYFYRLEADGVRLARKLLVVR
jgi:Cu/Zn superoxide dismutase